MTSLESDATAEEVDLNSATERLVERQQAKNNEDNKRQRQQERLEEKSAKDQLRTYMVNNDLARLEIDEETEAILVRKAKAAPLVAIVDAILTTCKVDTSNIDLDQMIKEAREELKQSTPVYYDVKIRENRKRKRKEKSKANASGDQDEGANDQNEPPSTRPRKRRTDHRPIFETEP